VPTGQRPYLDVLWKMHLSINGSPRIQAQLHNSKLIRRNSLHQMMLCGSPNATLFQIRNKRVAPEHDSKRWPVIQQFLAEFKEVIQAYDIERVLPQKVRYFWKLEKHLDTCSVASKNRDNERSKSMANKRLSDERAPSLSLALELLSLPEPECPVLQQHLQSCRCFHPHGKTEHAHMLATGPVWRVGVGIRLGANPRSDSGQRREAMWLVERCIFGHNPGVLRSCFKEQIHHQCVAEINSRAERRSREWHARRVVITRASQGIGADPPEEEADSRVITLLDCDKEPVRQRLGVSKSGQHKKLENRAGAGAPLRFLLTLCQRSKMEPMLPEPPRSMEVPKAADTSLSVKKGCCTPSSTWSLRRLVSTTFTIAYLAFLLLMFGVCVAVFVGCTAAIQASASSGLTSRSAANVASTLQGNAQWLSDLFTITHNGFLK
jgi:hypothetical protein